MYCNFVIFFQQLLNLITVVEIKYIKYLYVIIIGHIFAILLFFCRRLAGLRKEDIYNNLRIPDQFQTTKDDINIIILTGWCLFGLM